MGRSNVSSSYGLLPLVRKSGAFGLLERTDELPLLANEEVVDGKSERGGHPVIRVPMKQWMRSEKGVERRGTADCDSLRPLKRPCED
jgi:hypothetical protein